MFGVRVLPLLACVTLFKILPGRCYIVRHTSCNGRIFDTHRRQVECYPDVPRILRRLHDEGYLLGVASRTSCIQEAKDLVKLFDWEKYFKYKEIYPGSKITHFKKFHQDSGIAFQDMIFFDDELRNIRDVGSLGVTCIPAYQGMSNSVLREGLENFAAKFKSSSEKK